MWSIRTIFFLLLCQFANGQFVIDSYKYASTEAYPDLIAYYRFDLNTSDAKGNLGDASHTGTSITTSNGRTALHIGNTDNYASIAHDALMDFTDGAGNDEAFSVSFMAYITDETQYVVSKMDNATDGWEIFYDGASNDLFFRLWTSSGNVLGKSYDISGERNGWFHFVVTYDGSETETGILIYGDGTLQATSVSRSSGSYTGVSSTSTPIRIGAPEADLTLSNFVNGVSNLGFWGKELSSTEVGDIYAIEVTGSGYLLSN